MTTVTNGSIPVKAKLYLVDLAGSERVDKSGACVSVRVLLCCVFVLA